MKSVRELYEKANQTSSTTNKFLSPEIVKSGDKTTIVGPMVDLALRGADWSDEYGGSVTFRFEDSNGSYITKRVYEIDLTKFEEFAKNSKAVKEGAKTAQQAAEERAEGLLNNLIYLHNRAFPKNSKNPHIVQPEKLDGVYTVKEMVKAIFEDAPFEDTPYNIAVKVELRETEGQYPKYSVVKYGTWWNALPEKLAFSKWEEDNLKLEFTRVQPEEDASSEDVPSVQDEDDDLL